MIDILYNCFESLNFYLIVIIGLLLYFFKKKSTQNELNKRINDSIESIERRSEECPQQYPNGWLPVYDSHDLKKGEVKPLFALGRDLVIYRGISGKVYVFDAHCPHLGANLGVGGTVVGDDIKCHFHGWRYNNQGDCNAIPGLEDKSIPKANIRKWRCDEVNDFIYVWHHLEGKRPDWFMPKLEKLENLIYRGKYIIETYCHIQDIMENQVDHVHLETIHGSDNVFPKFVAKFIKFQVISEFWKKCDPPNTHISLSSVRFNLKIGGRTIMSVSAEFPTTGPANFNFEFRTDFKIVPAIFLNVNIITVGKMKQAIFMQWYSERSIKGFILAKILLLVMGSVASADLPVWNYKRYLKSPVYTRLDEKISQFRRWYKQFYTNISLDSSSCSQTFINEAKMADSSSMESSESKLFEHIESEEFGNGELALVAYNTAWVARIANENGTPKFEESLKYLRHDQYSDGRWGASFPISLFDRIITTLMVLITLKEWNMDEDQDRIRKGVKYLNENFEHLTQFEEIKDQMTSGFEVLMPMLIEQAEKMGIISDIPKNFQPYLKAKEEKMRKMEDSKMKSQITENKSWHFVLEAFGNFYSIEKLQELVKDNSLIASSYCSTAYALYRGIKSEESIKHLEKIVKKNKGGVPSLYKVEIFDLAWSLNSLIFSGFPIEHKSLKIHLDKLESLWKNSDGILGAAIGSPQDADDTANVILALNRSGRLTQKQFALGKLFQFFHQDHFITYEGERDESLSSNLNCLITLKDFLNDEQAASIVKCVSDWTKKFLINRDYNFNDKWHMSKYYGMGRALIAFNELDIDFSKEILRQLTSEQRDNGGWGAFDISTRLETSYAVLAIIYCLKTNPTFIKNELVKCLKMAKIFMDECEQDEQVYKFWIEKYLYCPINVDKMSILCACYALDQFDFHQNY